MLRTAASRVPVALFTAKQFVGLRALATAAAHAVRTKPRTSESRGRDVPPRGPASRGRDVASRGADSRGRDSPPRRAVSRERDVASRRSESRREGPPRRLETRGRDAPRTAESLGLGVRAKDTHAPSRLRASAASPWPARARQRVSDDGEGEGFVAQPRHAPRVELTEREVEQLKKMIVYQDSQILVLNKPHGLLVQGQSKETTKSLDGMLHALQFNAKEPPRIVHRLDRDTSGVLVLARTLEAAQILSRHFKKGKLTKSYVGITMGAPSPSSGTISIPIEVTQHKSILRPELTCVSSPVYHQLKGRAQNATTDFETIVENELAALVRFFPRTGRKHQIRVHAADQLRTPLVGDFKYGDGCNVKLKNALGVSEWEIPALRLFLHAHEITLPSICSASPRKAETFTVKAPIPRRFRAMMVALGLDAPI